MSAADIPAGLRLSAASGWNQLEEDWQFFVGRPGNRAFLIERAGEILGTVAYIHYGELAWIAMMLVDARERRGGLGSQLMQHVLAALEDAPAIGLDATPAGEPLYQRFDFFRQSELLRLKGQALASHFHPTPGAVRPIASTELARVLQRDREVFGADRGALLESLWRRAPECAWIAETGGALRGYCFGRPGRLFHQLGPVMADDAATAQELASAALTRLDNRLTAIDVPRSNPGWLAWLTARGFAEERPFARMMRRGHSLPGTPALQYAITGPEFA